MNLKRRCPDRGEHRSSTFAQPGGNRSTDPSRAAGHECTKSLKLVTVGRHQVCDRRTFPLSLQPGEKGMKPIGDQVFIV